MTTSTNFITHIFISIGKLKTKLYYYITFKDASNILFEMYILTNNLYEHNTYFTYMIQYFILF